MLLSGLRISQLAALVQLALAAAGTDQPGLDSKFPQRQPLVGVKRDPRIGREDQILATSVLQQIGAQLVEDLMLDSLVTGTVLRREPHEVLVGHVNARDRDRS